MSNEYKDWLLDRAVGAYNCIAELDNTLKILVNNETDDLLVTDLCGLYDELNNYFKEYGTALQMFHNREFNSNLLPLLHQIEEYISLRVYPIIIEERDNTKDDDLKATCDVYIRSLLTWYSEDELKEIAEQSKEGEIYN